MIYKRFTECLGGGYVGQIDSLDEAGKVYGRIVKENEEDGLTFAYNGERWVRTGLIGEALETVIVSINGHSVKIERQFQPRLTRNKSSHDVWSVFFKGNSKWGYLPAGNLGDSLSEIVEQITPVVLMAANKEAELLLLASENEGQAVPKSSSTCCYKCGVWGLSDSLWMTGSLGILCPDCYDDAEEDL